MIAMVRKVVILFAAWLFGASLAAAGPAQVILIRHGEKPRDGPELSLKGQERAAALVPYFLGTPEVLQYKTPVAIYAQKSTAGHASKRPVQTVQGLADKLKLPVLQYAHKDFARMVEEINAKPEYEGKMVLICWEHKGIPDIVKAFGIKNAPDKYPGHAFDRTWIITFARSPGQGRDGKPTFQDLPQKLMYGDSDK
jgi:hypothetical protein